MMVKLTITTGTDKEFFQRGRELARKLDKGERIPAENIMTFEDSEDLPPVHPGEILDGNKK